jgi:hypothetical protein
MTTAFSQVSLEAAKKTTSVSNLGNVAGSEARVLNKPEQQFMPYMALKFRTASSNYNLIYGGERLGYSMGMMDIDTTVFQEITDEFHKIFKKRMAEIGFTYVDDEAIKSSKGYATYSETANNSRFFSSPYYGEARICTQNNVPMIDLPAGALGMKINKWQIQMNAALSNLKLTIDFTEFDPKNFGTHKVYETANGAKFTPVIKVDCNFTELEKPLVYDNAFNEAPGLILGTKMLYWVRFDSKPFYKALSPTDFSALYKDEVKDWASDDLAKFNSKWKSSTTAEPWVIKVDRETYKNLVLQALNEYLDHLTAVAASYKK